MSSIPILYTGKEAARFNWNALGENMRDSYRRIHENAVNQQRYNDIQAQRQQQMLLKEMDVDRISFGNEQVQAIETNMYDDFVNKTANLVAEKKGNLNTQDYLLVKTMANKYERDMSAYKQSEERRIKDYAVATDQKNITKFDKDKVKENIAYWDYRNGMYPTDALDKSLRELTEEELIQKDARDSKNADYVATYVLPNDDKSSGGDYQTKVQEEYEKKFYERTSDGKGNTVTALKAEPAVQFMKDRYSIGGREQDFASINKMFQKQTPIKQQAYLNKWGDDAQIAWWTLDNPDRTEGLFPLVTKVSQVKQSESGGSGGGMFISFGGGKTKNNLTESIETKYGDVDMPNFYEAGTANIKFGKNQEVKNARIYQGGKLSEAKNMQFDDAVFVGVNLEDGKATEVVLSIPEKATETNAQGDIIYTNNRTEGTLPDLVKRFTESGAKDVNEETLVSLYGFSPKESDERTIVVAPASENTKYLKNFVVDGKAVNPTARTKKPSETTKKSTDDRDYKFDYSKVDYNTLTDEQHQATNWLKANENDPRAEAIYKSLIRK